MVLPKTVQLVSFHLAIILGGDHSVLLNDFEIPVVGKRGSLFIYHNELWHAIGANTTINEDRFFANAFYIPGLIHRPREI